MFKQHWFRNGIINIKNLMDEQNNFLSHTAFLQKYKINCNFLEYYSLISAIPNEWKYYIRQHRVENRTSQEDMLYNLNKVFKVCKFIHRISVEKLFKAPTSQIKWASILNVPVNWNKLYMIPFKCCLSTKLRYFQFKLFNRILGVNKHLYNMGLSDSNLCTFCSSSVESISHLFWDCPIPQQFIQNFQTSILNNEVNLNKNLFLFGCPDVQYSTVNRFILHAKYFIFSTRCKGDRLSFSSFKNILKRYCEIERVLSQKNHKFVLSLDNSTHVQLL